jgi:putative aminopeptidase FrvX
MLSNGMKLKDKNMDELFKPYVDTFITDTYGTAVGVINPDALYKVVIEGHADEIAWYVNYINDEGMVYVIRNGSPNLLNVYTYILKKKGKEYLDGLQFIPATRTKRKILK